MLVNLINVIHVYEGSRIHIQFRYQYHYDMAVSCIETVGSLAEMPDNNLIKEAV
jgi:hypothetical protein